jgi:hypothetical protein
MGRNEVGGWLLKIQTAKVKPVGANRSGPLFGVPLEHRPGPPRAGQRQNDRAWMPGELALTLVEPAPIFFRECLRPHPSANTSGEKGSCAVFPWRKFRQPRASARDFLKPSKMGNGASSPEALLIGDSFGPLRGTWVSTKTAWSRSILSRRKMGTRSLCPIVPRAFREPGKELWPAFLLPRWWRQADGWEARGSSLIGIRLYLASPRPVRKPAVSGRPSCSRQIRSSWSFELPVPPSYAWLRTASRRSRARSS